MPACTTGSSCSPCCMVVAVNSALSLIVCVCVSCRDGFFAVRERSVYLHSSYHLIDFHDVLCMGVCVCFVCKLVGLCVWVFLYI